MEADPRLVECLSDMRVLAKICEELERKEDVVFDDDGDAGA
jgi:hypothetical protein